MAFRYFIDLTVNCVFASHRGDFDLTQSEKRYRTVIDSSKYRSGLNFLQDLRYANVPEDYTYKFIQNTLEKFVDSLDDILGDCRVAIVVGSAADFKIYHQLITTRRLSATKVDRKVFREMDTAREWLGVPDDYEINFPDGG